MYNLTWKASAEKDLRRLPKAALTRLVSIAEALRVDPFPKGGRKLAGTDKSYRVRSGNYRLVYTVDSGHLVIEVIAVGHRKDVYQ